MRRVLPIVHFSLISLLLTALAYPAFSEDIQTLINKAESGNPEVQFNLGVAYGKGEGVLQDYVEAAKWYRMAAEQGFTQAQNNLGLAYGKGEGVPRDYAEAMKWYRMAAEQGLAQAQNNLGVAYDKGEGVPQDYAESIKWFLMAAEQGHAVAQCNLGTYYDDGKGVPQDYLFAYFWWSLATTRNTGGGYDRCAYYRDRAAKQLTPEQLIKAQQMISDWEAKHPRK